MKKRKPKTSPEQLARVRDWEARNPERAQARKDKWAKSPAGRAWLKANQAKINARRDAWRARKKAEKTAADAASAAPKTPRPRKGRAMPTPNASGELHGPNT